MTHCRLFCTIIQSWNQFFFCFDDMFLYAKRPLINKVLIWELLALNVLLSYADVFIFYMSVCIMGDFY